MPRWLVAGAVLGFLAVLLGAFGAHGLAPFLSTKELANWHTAVLYQMFHGIALVGLGLWPKQKGREIQIAGWAFLVGTLLFSGSLYLMALIKVRALGAITPLGGALFLVGWGAMIKAALDLIKASKK